MSQGGLLSRRIQRRQVAVCVVELAASGDTLESPPSREWLVRFGKHPGPSGRAQLTISELCTGCPILSRKVRTPDSPEIEVFLARMAARYGMPKSVLLSKTAYYSPLLRQWCDLNGVPLEEELDFTCLVEGAARPVMTQVGQSKFRWDVTMADVNGRRYPCVTVFDPETLCVAAAVFALSLTEAALARALDGASRQYGVPVAIQVDRIDGLVRCVAHWSFRKGVRVEHRDDPPTKIGDGRKSGY